MRILIQRGAVIDFTVVQLSLVGSRLRPVVRYDTAHGYAHRETLGWDGRVADKHWMPQASYGEALSEAILDVKSHWEQYFDEFLKRRPRP